LLRSKRCEAKHEKGQEFLYHDRSLRVMTHTDDLALALLDG
jgi:hypothetical protein